LDTKLEKLQLMLSVNMSARAAAAAADDHHHRARGMWSSSSAITGRAYL
jgi:hypothetical protein